MEQKIGFLHANDAGSDRERGNSEMGLLEYWKVLRKRSKVAIFTTIAAAVIGAVVLLIVPWNYQSQSRIELNFATASPLDQLGLPSAAASLLGSSTDNEIGTEINALQSEELITKIINDQGLFLDPDFVGARRARENKSNSTPWFSRPKERDKEITHFEKLLDVEADPKSFNVDVSFSYPNAVVSEKVLKDLLDNYVKGRIQTRYDTVMQTTAWLSGQLGGFKKIVDDSERTLSDFTRTHQIIESGSSPSASLGGGIGAMSAPPVTSAGSNSLEVEHLVDLDHQLVAAKSAEIVAEAKYRLSLTQSPDAMSSIFSDAILTADEAQLATLQVQLAEARTRLGLRHPHVLELEKTIQEAQKQTDDRLATIRTGFKNDYESALSNEELLQKQVDASTAHTTGRLDSYLQYEKLESDLNSEMALYQGLKQQLQEAGITASLDATHVNIINPPTIPYKYSSPMFPIVIPALLFLSLVIGGTGAFLAEHLDDSLLLPSQVEEESRIAVMGVVPHFEATRPIVAPSDTAGATEAGTQRDIDPSVMTTAPDSAAAEAYRAIRSSVLLLSSVPPKVILVTSSIPAEGKSTTSLNLATAMAQKGSRVLLIDGDLRSPVLHRRFMVPMPVGGGLSALLTQGHSALDKSLLQVGKTGSLTLLPAGAKPPIPGDLLDSEAARDLINEFRGQYDSIVIDSPPILAVNDSLILGRYADAVLIVVRARRTPKSALIYSARRLRDEKLPVKGIIFTDLNYRSQEYQYSAYYYAYDNRYYSK